MNDTSADTGVKALRCPATKDTLVRLLVLAAMCLGFGAWCFHDGYMVEKTRQKALAPDADINAKSYYHFNRVAGVALPILGILPLVLAVRAWRRVIVADEEGIGYAGKEKIRWDRVTRLDSSKLKSKNALTLHFGEAGRLTLDGYKLMYFKELGGFVKRRVPPAALADDK